VADSHEHDNKPSDYTKGGQFVDKGSNYNLLENDSAY
jgi:hypothetical protein